MSVLCLEHHIAVKDKKFTDGTNSTAHSIMHELSNNSTELIETTWPLHAEVPGYGMCISE